MNVIPFPKNSCGGSSGRRQGRLILPVAPRANHRLRFAPVGTTAPPLLPAEACAQVDRLRAREKEPALVEIAGPGDPLALMEPTLDTIRLLKEKHPELLLEIATSGIRGARYAGMLAMTGADRILLLVEAVDPQRAAELYAWIRPGTKTVPLSQAVRFLIKEQAETVAACRQAGLPVGIRTTVYPGFNDEHVEEIASAMAAAGAESMILVPFRPEGDGDLPPAPDRELMERVRRRAAKHLSPAEAGEQTELIAPLHGEGGGVQAAGLPRPSGERPNVAVASTNGMQIDLHLGHAIRVLVYGPRDDGLPCLLETRPAPEPGSGSSRWEALADTLHDCFALLTASAGHSPKTILGRRDIKVLVTEGDIPGTVDVLYGGGKKGRKR